MWHVFRECNHGMYYNVSWRLARNWLVFIPAPVAKSAETSKRFLCNLYPLFFFAAVQRSSFEYSIEASSLLERSEYLGETSGTLRGSISRNGQQRIHSNRFFFSFYPRSTFILSNKIIVEISFRKEFRFHFPNIMGNFFVKGSNIERFFKQRMRVLAKLLN